jgi:hypothetical protein
MCPLDAKTLLAGVSVMLVACAFNPPPPPPPAVTLKEGPGPYSFDCEAPAATFASEHIRAPAGDIRITGSFRFVQTHPDPIWAPTALITLLGRSDFNLRAVVSTTQTPATIQLSALQGPKVWLQGIFATVPLSDRTLDFTLTRKDSRHITVSVGGETKTVAITPLNLTRIDIGCSSADVQFSNVTLTESKPQ